MKLLKTLPILALLQCVGGTISAQTFQYPAKNNADYRYKSTYENAAYLSAEKYNHQFMVQSGYEFMWKSVDNNNLGPQSSIIPGSTSVYDNIDESGPVMQAYLSLYRSTGRDEYLEHFIKIADNILQRRDDARHAINPALSNVESPTWQKMNYVDISYDHYADMLASGILSYPLADFVYLVMVEQPALQANVMSNYSAPIFNGSCTTCNPLVTTFSGQSFLDIAHHISDRVKETLNHHDQTWITENYAGTEIGSYTFGITYLKDNGFYTNGEWKVPLNYQATMGRAHLMMWMATGDTYYEEHARRLANNLRANMHLHMGASGPDKYFWTYWDKINPLTSNLPGTFNNYEDMSHASYDVHFAYLCYKHGLKYASGSPVNVFDMNDMQRLSNTFLNAFYGDRNITNYVNGSDGSLASNYYLYDVAGWVPLLEFNKDLYPIFSEIFTTNYTNGTGALSEHIRCSTSTISSKYFDALAHLKEHERHFNPLWEVHHSPQSDWTSSTVGDLDGNGIPELIVVRNVDHTIYGYEFTTSSSGTCGNGNLSFKYSMQLPAGFHGYLTTGNFDGQTGEELAVLNKYSNTVYFFKNNGSSSLVSLPSTINNFSYYQDFTGITAMDDVNGDGKDEIIATDFHKLHIMMSGGSTPSVYYNTILNTGTFGSGSDLVGAASGDIDGDGIKEFVTARNHDSNVYGYKLNASGTLSSVGALLLNFPPNTMQWRGITCGDFNADRKDEIAMVAESDGDIYIYKYYGGGTIGGSIAREQYLPGYENFVIAAGDLFQRDIYTSGYGAENSGCCPRDEIAVLRNLDGRMYVYETNLPSECPDDILVECTEEDGGSGSGGGEEQPDGEHDVVVELKAYPNPANEYVNFEIYSTDKTEVSLALYDSKGVLVKQLLADDVIEIGYQTIKFELDGLEPGMYIYQLIGDKAQESGTLMILE